MSEVLRLSIPSAANKPIPTCWICGEPLRVGLAHRKSGKASLMLWCSIDGRHWRSFVNHAPTVEEIVARLEAQAGGADPAHGAS